MRLFNNPGPVVVAIVTFVLLFLWFVAANAHENPESEISFQAGSAMLRGETPAIGLTLRWPDAGPGTLDYEFGFFLSGESEYYRENPNAFTLYGLLVANKGPVELGFGFAHTNVPWEYSCQDTAALMAGYRKGRWTVRWNHFSSAGSCKPNAGRDFLTVGWRF